MARTGRRISPTATLSTWTIPSHISISALRHSEVATVVPLMDVETMLLASVVKAAPEVSRSRRRDQVRVEVAEPFVEMYEAVIQ